MSEQKNEVKESQKTVTAFVAGLLVGGLLVWVFSSPNTETQVEIEDGHSHADEMEVSNDVDSTTDTDAASILGSDVVETTTDAKVAVTNQGAGDIVVLNDVTYPTAEGWVGVREYQNDKLGSLLGVSRYSREQGLTPTTVELLRTTEAGNEYAIVFYRENGDNEFNMAEDVQLGGSLNTFMAK